MVVGSAQASEDTGFASGVDGMLLVGLESEKMQKDGRVPTQPYSLNKRVLRYPFGQFSHMGAHT